MGSSAEGTVCARANARECVSWANGIEFQFYLPVLFRMTEAKNGEQGQVSSLGSWT